MNDVIINVMKKVLAGAKIIDLSYTMEPRMPVWPTHARFGAVVYESYDDGGISFHRQVSFGEHTGTHIDAPNHFIKGGKSIDEVSLGSTVGRAVRIDASFLPPCAAYTLDMLKKFEQEEGAIEKGDLVFLYFGQGDKYALGKESLPFLENWPGLSGEAAQYLVEKGVSAVGTDALALDPFGSEDFPCHYILLGNDVPIIETMKNLDKLPTHSFVIGLPLKLKDGSASPLRMIALIEET